MVFLCPEHARQVEAELKQTELGRSGRSLEDWADSAGAGWLDMEELADSAGAGRLDEDGSGALSCRYCSCWLTPWRSLQMPSWFRRASWLSWCIQIGSGRCVFHIWFLISHAGWLSCSGVRLISAAPLVVWRNMRLRLAPALSKSMSKFSASADWLVTVRDFFLSSFDLLLLCCLLMIFLDGSYSLSQSTAMTPSTRWGSGSG